MLTGSERSHWELWVLTLWLGTVAQLTASLGCWHQSSRSFRQVDHSELHSRGKKHGTFYWGPKNSAPWYTCFQTGQASQDVLSRILTTLLRPSVHFDDVTRFVSPLDVSACFNSSFQILEPRWRLPHHFFVLVWSKHKNSHYRLAFDSNRPVTASLSSESIPKNCIEWANMW